jgi:hypothetical protein
MEWTSAGTLLVTAMALKSEVRFAIDEGLLWRIFNFY